MYCGRTAELEKQLRVAEGERAEAQNAANEIAKMAEALRQERDKLAAEARGSARATALNFAISYHAKDAELINTTRIVDTANKFLLFLRGEPTVSPPTGEAPPGVDSTPGDAKC